MHAPDWASQRARSSITRTPRRRGPRDSSHSSALLPPLLRRGSPRPATPDGSRGGSAQPERETRADASPNRRFAAGILGAELAYRGALLRRCRRSACAQCIDCAMRLLGCLRGQEPPACVCCKSRNRGPCLGRPRSPLSPLRHASRLANRRCLQVVAARCVSRLHAVADSRSSS